MDNQPPPHKTWTSSPGALIEIAPAYSAHQFMVLGLKNAKILNWQCRKENTNIDAFRRKYSGTPQTVEDIYNKMRLSADVRIRLRANAKPMHLLLALRFIRKYEAEEDLGNFFGILSRTTVEKYLNEYMPRIHLLMVNRLAPNDWNKYMMILSCSCLWMVCKLRPMSNVHSPLNHQASNSVASRELTMSLVYSFIARNWHGLMDRHGQVKWTMLWSFSVSWRVLCLPVH